MERLRDKLNPFVFFITYVFISGVLVYFTHASPTVAGFLGILGIALTLGIFYVIDKLADRKVLERIHHQQTEFNKEFRNFRLMFASRLESMPFLYPIIDDVQNHIIYFCNSYPENFRYETDFKTATYELIIARLNRYIETNRYSRNNNSENVQKLIEEIKRMGRIE